MFCFSSFAARFVFFCEMFVGSLRQQKNLTLTNGLSNHSMDYFTSFHTYQMTLHALG